MEGQIYDGFTSAADQTLLDKFHRLPWDKRLPIVESLEDVRLRQLGKRLLYFESPEVLDEVTRTEYDQLVARRILRKIGDEPWLTLDVAIAELEELMSSAGQHEISLLRDHHAYLKAQREKAARMVG